MTSVNYFPRSLGTRATPIAGRAAARAWEIFLDSPTERLSTALDALEAELATRWRTTSYITTQKTSISTPTFGT